MKAIIEGDLSIPLLGSKSVEDLTGEDNAHDESIDITSQSHGEGMHAHNSTDKHLMLLLDKGYLEYGCTHFRRRCRIRAPCCNQIFDCRRCHDESKYNDKDGHKLPWKEVRQVICSLCNTEQEVQQICINCGVCMGRYFCGICKAFNDDVIKYKKMFHCLGCGMCRMGDQFSHCNKCRCCRGTHKTCLDGVLHRDCPICFEYLFETPGPFSVMPCGHMIHHRCFLKLNQNTCPICSKTFADMSGRNTTWRLQIHRFLGIFKTNW